MLKKDSIKVVIFDMDGVISNTQVIHAQIESELLKAYDIKIHPDEITKKYSGVSDNDMFQDVFQNAKQEVLDLEQLVERKREIMNQAVRSNVKEVLGTREFIERLKVYSVPLAVASSSQVSFIEFVLSDLNLIEKFDAITSAEEVRKGKPAPDIFLLAAKK